MSLHIEIAFSVPEQTARVARAAFPKGNRYLILRDQLGTLFEDQQFTDLYPPQGQPAHAPWRLALVTVMQFAEGMSDRQAADAVRSRIDWKYVMGLELTDPGFDYSVLCEFRARLLQNGAEQRLFDTLLTLCRERGLIKAGGKQRTDSTHVLASVRALNRYRLVQETLRVALDALAVAAPRWLLKQVPPEWNARYARRAEHNGIPTKQAERQAFLDTVGADGVFLLNAVVAAEAPANLRDLPALRVLRRVWLQNYQQTDKGLEWREADNIPPASCFVSSPHDTDAHLAKKGSTCWVDYKVHLTETCDEQMPPLITHVETMVAPIADGEATPRVHKALRDKALLPKTHIVDTGYLDAALLVSTQEYGVDTARPHAP